MPEPTPPEAPVTSTRSPAFRPRAFEHLLAGQIGAAEGGEFDVGEIGIDDMGVLRRQRHVFGITAIAAVAHVVDVGKAVVVAVVDREIDHHALADAAF